MPRLFLLALAVLLTGCAKAPAPVLEITDYGTYSALIVTKGDWKLKPPVEIATVEELKHQETTTRIPCKDGVYWGLRAQVTNPHSDRSVHITCTIHHPPITSPDGKTSSEDVHPFPDLEPGQVLTLNSLWFFLDASSFEFVPGRWTMRIDVDGQPAASKTFEIYRP